MTVNVFRIRQRAMPACKIFILCEYSYIQRKFCELIIFFLEYFLDHVNYVGEDEKFGAMAISYKRERTEIPLQNEDDGTIVQYEYRVIIRTSEVSSPVKNFNM